MAPSSGRRTAGFGFRGSSTPSHLRYLRRRTEHGSRPTSMVLGGSRQRFRPSGRMPRRSSRVASRFRRSCIVQWLPGFPSGRALRPGRRTARRDTCALRARNASRDNRERRPFCAGARAATLRSVRGPRRCRDSATSRQRKVDVRVISVCHDLATARFRSSRKAPSSASTATSRGSRPLYEMSLRLRNESTGAPESAPWSPRSESPNEFAT